MQTSGYPCPACAAPADLIVGCRTCGRGPDPTAAEVVRLDAEITVLAGRLEQARRAYRDLGVALGAAQRRRADLAARVRASRTVPAQATVAPAPAMVRPPRPAVAPTPSAPLRTGLVPPGPVPSGPPQIRPVAAGPVPVGPAAVGGTPAGQRETSTRTVQSVLFVLGGLLLGTAAIVFTAVAWAAVGVVGRAAILAAVTALALAVPAVVVRRGLRGTAETVAAVGLLLVLLDGYAAWAVDLVGVAGWPVTRYAALVGGASAAVATGYALLTRLSVPWFGALLVAQPVLPLLAVEARPGVAGWTLVFAGVALVDLAVVHVLSARVGAGGPLAVAGRVAAWTGHALALAPAAVCAVVALVRGEAFGTPLAAGLPLLVVGVVLAGAALVAGSAVLRAVAAALLVVVSAPAVLRPVAELRPSVLLVTSAVVVLALAGAVRALPAGLRSGPRAGALVVAGVMAHVVLVPTGGLAAAAVLRSVPPWRGATAGPDLPWGWQLPVAVLLTVGAGLLLLPRVARIPVALGGGVVAVLAAPAVRPAPWPAVVALGLAAGVVLLLVAVFRSGGRAYHPPLAAAAGVLLTGHALLVGLAAPVGAGAVLAGVLIVGLVVAGRARRLDGPVRWLAGPALTVALLAVPALVVVTQIELDPALPWRLRGPAVAVGLLPVALVAVRRHWPDLQRYAGAALAGALPVAGLAPVVVPAGESVPVYLSAAVLVAVVGAAVVRPTGGLRVVGVALAVATGAVLVPAAFRVLVAPYGWLGSVWSGVPDGVGLAPGMAPARLSVGVAFLVLLLAVAVAARSTLLGRDRAVLIAVPVGAVAVPVLLGGAGAPWPVLPAVSLLLGAAGLLFATLTTAPTVAAPAPPAGPVGSPADSVTVPSDSVTVPSGSVTVPSGPGLVPSGPGSASPVRAARPSLLRLVLPVLAGTGLTLAGAGLAGLLPTRAGTLAGLGLALVVAVVVGVAGRVDAVRPVGWAGAALTATAFAVTATVAADLPLRTAGSAVLAVAVLVLGTAALLARRRPAEGLVLDAAAQGVALTALLLSVGSRRQAALVCVLWGTAVALRALRPGESVGRRWTFAAVAGGSVLLGAWLLLTVAEVTLLEAYTLPAAGLALLAGLVALRTRPGLTSWTALGPGLAAALLPSLVSVLVGADPQPWRRLLLGAGAVGVVLFGAVRRWQAPVVLGGSSLVPLALHEVVRSWDLVPRWIFLAVGGLALIGLATTYERRRRDLARLRSVVGRMG
ncbi:SCO7613 C-terminal domain-containing membrane protein [Micromonospora sp. NPDC050187]|uniref:SCO7613 C-terminal domain-containing membrane protein n=1 Tax=Micromonospora sp. NPDC050187 TaxID=3364277 RepID=UPI0037894DB3